jgi:hypothetical protein
MSAATLDVRKLVLPSGPSEWETVDAEVLAGLKPDARGLLTPDQWRTMQSIWGRRWFLLRADTGLCSRCTRCHVFHRYVTLGCLPRPWNGITELFGVLEAEYGEGYTQVIRFGDIVPITRADAFRLYEQIRGKGFQL